VKRILLTSAALFLAAAVFAQQNTSHLTTRQLKKIKRSQIQRNEQNGGGTYDHEFDVGGRLNTNGWSAYLEYEKRTSEVASTMFQFEVAEIKDPKEDKNSKIQGVDAYGFAYSGHAYVYGKQNIFYQARLGIGQRRLIGGKGNKNGVEVSAIYLGGVSLGLVKPYYLELVDSTAGSASYQKYTPENANSFLNPNNIIAGPGLGKGWSEVQMVPGLYARIGMRFDWAEFNEFVSALEVGLSADLYSKKVQIMVNNPGKSFFYGAYVSLIFGKRW
jgi:hypothetical protein